MDLLIYMQDYAIPRSCKPESLRSGPRNRFARRSVLCYPWVLYNGYPWLPHFWESVGFVAEAAYVSFQANIIDTSAHCGYGNPHNPFEVLSGTVTNLTIA